MIAEAVVDQMSLVRSLSAELTTLVDVVDDSLDTRPVLEGVDRRRLRP